MKYAASLAALVFACAFPAYGQSDLEQGFDGALRGCEKWILDPASWVDGPAPFKKAIGLGTKMGLVRSVEDVNLPPAEWRRGNLYWRINSTEGAGYILIVSDQIPMCHITGGGNTDLQPVVEAVIVSPMFNSRWARQASSFKGGMITTRFRNRKVPALSILISRADKPHQRLDHVQIVATAFYAMGK